MALPNLLINYAVPTTNSPAAAQFTWIRDGRDGQVSTQPAHQLRHRYALLLVSTRLIHFEDAGYPYDSEWYDEVGGHSYLYDQGKGKPWHSVDVVIAHRVGKKRWYEY